MRLSLLLLQERQLVWMLLTSLKKLFNGKNYRKSYNKKYIEIDFQKKKRFVAKIVDEVKKTAVWDFITERTEVEAIYTANFSTLDKIMSSKLLASWTDALFTSVKKLVVKKIIDLLSRNYRSIKLLTFI